MSRLPRLRWPGHEDQGVEVGPLHALPLACLPTPSPCTRSTRGWRRAAGSTPSLGAIVASLRIDFLNPVGSSRIIGPAPDPRGSVVRPLTDRPGHAARPRDTLTGFSKRALHSGLPGANPARAGAQSSVA